MEKRAAAGIFLLMSAIMGFITAILEYLISVDDNPSTWSELHREQAIMYGILSVVTLVGAIYSFTGAYMTLPIIGALTGMLATGPLWLGFVFALIALILLTQSKGEFEAERERRKVFEGHNGPEPPQY